MRDLCVLRYRVAELAFDLYTVVAGRLAALLHSYAPFAEPWDEGQAPLFSLYLGQSVEMPQQGEDPTEQGLWLGLHSELYKQPAGHSIFLSQEQDPSGVWASTQDGWLSISTTVQGRHSYDALYIKALVTTALCIRGLPLGLVKMHASVVLSRGQAIAFLGRSGTGKSTHARLCLETLPDASLLNDDEPILRLYPDGRLYVYGSPWSGDTACYKNERAELLATVQLQQAHHNQIRKCTAVEAIQYLLSATALLRSDEGYRHRLYQQVLGMLEYLPVYHLACLPNLEAAQLSCRLFCPSSTEGVADL